MDPSAGNDGTTSAGRRFLIVSAGMGSGHAAVAAELMRRLAAAGHTAAGLDVLQLLPPGVGRGVREFYRVAVCRVPAVYAAVYAVFLRPGKGPRPGNGPLAALAEKRFLRLVEEWRPDVIVPVFHLAAQLTGRLRARGSLAVPSAVVITDFAVHRQWLHPGNDLNLCLTPGIAREVRGSAGRSAVVSGPLVARRFRAPADAGGWTDILGGTERGPVLISTGAWGAGNHVLETARVIADAGFLPVVLCGRNSRLRSRVSGTPGVPALGWVTDMPGLLAASRALVDNAAGQTALEALAAGLPVIGYRPIPGHGKDGVRRMAEEGLTAHATGPRSLIRALDEVTVPGPVRERRAAEARRLFGADALPHLEDLAGA
ncbi:MGDG synthase family glycosyltransferase [Streptomyces sp. NBC_01716]|uniref:MGDG synthase family glycosyltransferase n=1 Tax=Streptomyces sp. NBC_01716 TaxID=2975917 RepID=UPI002E37A9E2|nr:galactosyldiacylglycerol synthase [Streptomyces sp. NBC_01716]